MARLNKERQQELEPQRIEFAKNEIEKLGYDVIVYEKNITFLYKDNLITFFPYSGWASGKGIKSGRGLQNLLNQIQE